MQKSGRLVTSTSPKQDELLCPRRAEANSPLREAGGMTPTALKPQQACPCHPQQASLPRQGRSRRCR